MFVFFPPTKWTAEEIERNTRSIRKQYPGLVSFATKTDVLSKKPVYIVLPNHSVSNVNYPKPSQVISWNDLAKILYRSSIQDKRGREQDTQEDDTSKKAAVQAADDNNSPYVQPSVSLFDACNLLYGETSKQEMLLQMIERYGSAAETCTIGFWGLIIAEGNVKTMAAKPKKLLQDAFLTAIRNLNKFPAAIQPLPACKIEYWTFLQNVLILPATAPLPFSEFCHVVDRWVLSFVHTMSVQLKLPSIQIWNQIRNAINIWTPLEMFATFRNTQVTSSVEQLTPSFVAFAKHLIYVDLLSRARELNEPDDEKTISKNHTRVFAYWEKLRDGIIKRVWLGGGKEIQHDDRQRLRMLFRLFPPVPYTSTGSLFVKSFFPPTPKCQMMYASLPGNETSIEDPACGCNCQCSTYLCLLLANEVGLLGTKVHGLLVENHILVVMGDITTDWQQSRDTKIIETTKKHQNDSSDFCAKPYVELTTLHPEMFVNPHLIPNIREYYISWRIPVGILFRHLDFLTDVLSTCDNVFGFEAILHEFQESNLNEALEQIARTKPQWITFIEHLFHTESTRNTMMDAKTTVSLEFSRLIKLVGYYHLLLQTPYDAIQRFIVDLNSAVLSREKTKDDASVMFRMTEWRFNGDTSFINPLNKTAKSLDAIAKIDLDAEIAHNVLLLEQTMLATSL